MPSSTQYKCNKCGALVNATDVICPNGHDLRTVGRTINIILSEIIGLKDEVVKDSGDLKATFNVIKNLSEDPQKNREEIDENLNTFSSQIKKIDIKINKLSEGVEQIRIQTKPPTFIKKIVDHIIGGIIGFLIGLVLGTLLRLVLI